MSILPNCILPSVLRSNRFLREPVLHKERISHVSSARSFSFSLCRLRLISIRGLTPNLEDQSILLMPGFSNVRYRFYSDIDRLTAVLALHERKIAHWFDKVSANLEDCDWRDFYSITQLEHVEFSASKAGICFCTYSLSDHHKHRR